MTGLVFQSLSYVGPRMEPATISFQRGLNVVCGASETGKSFIVESIDYMLGGSEPLRDLPERSGYDRVRLGIGPDDESPITLERSVEGGDFRSFDGLIGVGEADSESTVLREKHSGDRDDTVSYVLLARVSLAGKVLRRNKSGATRSLSFRDLARLCVVTEDRIQTLGSPLLSGQWVQATSEYAAFKLLVTGGDDSALVEAKATADRAEVDRGKVELLDQMITELEVELSEQGLDETALRSRLEQLESSIAEQTDKLRAAEARMDDLLAQRSSVGSGVRARRGRLEEIRELTTRFTLLDQHYATDLRRLDAIRESGSIFTHLDPEQCPLCGAQPEEQHADADCDGNVSAIVGAAQAEMEKIERLRRELGETISSLDGERNHISRELGTFDVDYRRIEQELSEIVSPTVKSERASYEPLVLARAETRRNLDRVEQLHRLVEQRNALVDSPEDKGGAASRTEVSSSVLDSFSQTVQRILGEWHYPGADRVFFDEGKKDFQIAGKERGSSGKGLRAITHAAVSVALLEFCRERDLPHPGFVVLDSPLLAYWKPEGEEDDLRGTDIKERFYEYFLRHHADSQVVVIENEHPPQTVRERSHVVVFTKNPHHGRYGFFPVSS